MPVSGRGLPGDKIEQDRRDLQSVGINAGHVGLLARNGRAARFQGQDGAQNAALRALLAPKLAP